jgi:hypothetical protein
MDLLSKQNLKLTPDFENSKDNQFRNPDLSEREYSKFVDCATATALRHHSAQEVEAHLAWYRRFLGYLSKKKDAVGAWRHQKQLDRKQLLQQERHYQQQEQTALKGRSARKDKATLRSKQRLASWKAEREGEKRQKQEEQSKQQQHKEERKRHTAQRRRQQEAQRVALYKLQKEQEVMRKEQLDTALKRQVLKEKTPSKDQLLALYQRDIERVKAKRTEQHRQQLEQDRKLLRSNSS